MILPINNAYRIVGDEHGWSIQRPRTRKRHGRTVTTWESFKWYGSLDSCAKSLCHLMVRTSDAQTLGDALAEAENAVTSLCQALAPDIDLQRRVAGGRNHG